MAKSIVPFNYNEIYQSIAKKFIEKGYDAPYEGSNTAILTSILSYAIQGLNFNTAMNLNETILSLCKKRKSAVQNARILSYEPTHKISNQIKIFLHPKRAGTLTIPKFQEFKINGYSYYYFGDDIIQYITEEQLQDAGVWIQVKEGTLLLNSDYPSVLQYSLNEEAQYIDIPFNDIEDDGLIVTVDTYDDVGNKKTGIQYTKKKFILQDSADTTDNQYYRKDDLETGNARVYFRLGGLGTTLKEGSKIYVDVLRSSGSKPNSESFSGSIQGDLSGFAEIIFEGDKKPQNYIYGQEEESIESIKENAPLFFNTAGRCITENDYKAFLKLQNAVYQGYAWGGEDELIPQVGRVYFSCIPNLAEPEFVEQEIQTEKIKTGEELIYDSEGSPILDSVTGEPLKKDIYSTERTFVETSDSSKTGAYRKLNYNQNLYLSDGDLVSSINNIKEYATPGLQNYVKNPLYIFADINVDIKKYEYGVQKSEIHSKIFNTIKEYFDSRKGLDVNYVESTLIKQISEILGSDNGFTLDTLFSGYISANNKVQMISKDFDFSSSIISYNPKFDGDTLSITSYLNARCTIGDKISFRLSQTASDGLKDIQEVQVSLTAANINQGEVTAYAKALTELNLTAIWHPSTGGNSVTANEVPLSFKNIYFTTEVRDSVFTLSAVLNPSVKSGDKYDIFLIKNGILNKVDTKTLKASDILNGQIDYTYITKNPELESPDDIFIKVTQVNKDKTETYLESIKCKSLKEAQESQKSDESTIYDGLTGSAFIVTNTKQAKNNSYLVIMYLPDFMKVNDYIEINYGTETQNYKLTANDIKNKKATYTFKLDDLSVTNVSYTSKSDVVMTVIKYDEFSNDKLIPEADDRIQYSSEENAINAIEYTPTTQVGNKLTLKSNFNCSFYRNFENKLDIRNLIINYGNLSDYENGLNPKIQNLDVQVSSYEGASVSYNDFYVTCTNPQKLSYVDVSVNMTTAQGVEFTSFRIPIKESENSATQLSEGIGGIFLHLDIPPEGIYGDDGNLVIENLPVLYALGVNQNNKLYNLSSMGLDTKKELSRSDTTLSVMVYVDTNTEDETILKGMYPYFINSQVNKAQADNTYKWLRFPIKVSYGKQEQVIGTYVIVNAAKPYIRIKLKNEIINLFEDCEFEIVYPSNNFNTIRNTALRLRSVNITHDGENYTLRKIMKESKAEINSELFLSWVDTELDTMSAENGNTDTPIGQAVV